LRQIRKSAGLENVPLCASLELNLAVENVEKALREAASGRKCRVFAADDLPLGCCASIPNDARATSCKGNRKT
jgi:hypothetical protein